MRRTTTIALLLSLMATTGCRMLEAETRQARRALVSRLFCSFFLLQNEAPLSQNSFRPEAGVDVSALSAADPAPALATMDRVIVGRAQAEAMAGPGNFELGALIAAGETARENADPLWALSQHQQVRIRTLLDLSQMQIELPQLQKVIRIERRLTRCHAHFPTRSRGTRAVT